MITAKVAELICETYKSGYTVNEVALHVGCSPTTVSKVLRERGLTRPKGWAGRSAAKKAAAHVAVTDELIKRICMQRTCHVCGNTKHMQGATFCMDCGALLATKKQLAQQAADNLKEFLEPYKKTRNMENVFRDFEVVVAFIENASEEG